MSMIDEVALFALLTAQRFHEESAFSNRRFMYADDTFVAAWYEGKPVFCQRIESPLDQSHSMAEAQIELAKAGALADLTNPDEVLKMPCLNLS